jgi:hypothetical protein
MQGSDTEFPPHPDHQDGILLLVECYSCVVSGRTAWYVSSPLTSGQRSREWRRKNAKHMDGTLASTSDSFNRDVLAPNREDAARFVTGLRARQGEVVIDPTSLADITGWTQSDYRVFWARVIERYVATIVFRNGWQHSNGCAWELLTAYLADCRLLCEDLSPLEIAKARSLLETVVMASGEGPPSAFLVAVLRALNNREKE